MGTKSAPNFANISMGIFEDKSIYTLIHNTKLLYLRFTDDIFLLWTRPFRETNKI